jgi:hypothetical protein
MTAAERHDAAAETDVRRADWRFLLPMPPGRSFSHMTLLGGTPGLAVRLHGLKVASEISLSVQPGRRTDALVVLRDSDVDLHEAIDSLAAGGVLYCEVDRRTPRGWLWSPARLCRRLQDAGLRTIGLYWVVPQFDAARRFVPLRHPGALEWYFDAAYRQFSWRRETAARVARRWTRGGRSRFESFVPCYSVVAVEASAADTTPSLVAALPASAYGVDAAAPVALVTSGQDEGSRVVLLPFRDDELPGAAVKVSRVPAFNGHTIREHSTLQELRSRLTPDLRPTLPEPYWSGEWRGLAVSVESFAPGPTVLVSTGRHSASLAHQVDDLRAALEWLTGFHRQSQLSRERWTLAEIERWVEQPLEVYARLFDVDVRTGWLFAKARASARRLAGAHLPLVLQHHDFGPWNVHRSSRGITVIDWEYQPDGGPDRHGPAGMDAIYFATHWLSAAGHTHETIGNEILEQLFVSKVSPASAAGAAREVLASYMTALEIDPGFLPLLNVLTWVHHANDRTARRSLTAGARNHYVDCVRVLARHAEQLFAGN